MYNVYKYIWARMTSVNGKHLSPCETCDSIDCNKRWLEAGWYLIINLLSLIYDMLSVNRFMTRVSYDRDTSLFFQLTAPHCELLYNSQVHDT